MEVCDDLVDSASARSIQYKGIITSTATSVSPLPLLDPSTTAGTISSRYFVKDNPSISLISTSAGPAEIFVRKRLNRVVCFFSDESSSPGGPNFLQPPATEEREGGKTNFSLHPASTAPPYREAFVYGCTWPHSRRPTCFRQWSQYEATDCYQLFSLITAAAFTQVRSRVVTSPARVNDVCEHHVHVSAVHLFVSKGCSSILPGIPRFFGLAFKCECPGHRPRGALSKLESRSRACSEDRRRRATGVMASPGLLQYESACEPGST